MGGGAGVQPEPPGHVRPRWVPDSGLGVCVGAVAPLETAQASKKMGGKAVSQAFYRLQGGDLFVFLFCFYPSLLVEVSVLFIYLRAFYMKPPPPIFFDPAPT